MPLGNGYTGILIPGGIGQELIYFNRHDLWEGGSDAEIPDVTDALKEMRDELDRGEYLGVNKDNVGRLCHALREKGYGSSAGCPHPLGWMDVVFDPPALFKNYIRGINMQTGESFVNFTVGDCNYSRKAFVSRDSDVVVMRMTADAPFTVRYDFRLYNEVAECVTTENGFYRASADRYSAVRVQFVGDYTSAVSGNSLIVTGTDYMILVRCASHGSDSSLDAVAGKTYEELLDAHVALHRPLYDSLSIEISEDEAHNAPNEQMLAEAFDKEASPALLERLWRFGRYLFISASAPDSNPVPLYGLWHGAQYLAWSQYVANENVEITYWHTMAGGLSYAIPALLRYYTSKIETLRECAKKMFGARGIWVSAYTTPDASGACVPVAVIANWVSCAGWLCRHFWEYYEYTLDEKLLREEILPFMYEAALFYLDYAVDDGDYIRLYPSVSPENSPDGVPGVIAQNATMDFAILKELLTNLLRGIEITGMYTDDADSFKNLLTRIPPYMINEDGAIKEWIHPDHKDNYFHRHLSHIYPVFPGNEVTAFNQPELFDAFKQAVKLRKLGAQSGWSIAHMASIYARMGEGECSAECMDNMAKSVVMDSLLTTHNDWRNMGTTIYWEGQTHVQLDAAFGAVNAVQEMLFCWQKEALSILPALPARLASGSARGFVFPEGTVDIAWTAEGKVTVTVNATREIDTGLLLGGKVVGKVCLGVGESKTFSLSL